MAGINTSGLAQPNDYNLGRGTVYFATLTNGLPNEYRDLGNATEFNISVESEKLKHQSSREGLKVTDKEVVISQEVGLSLTLDELNFSNLALFMSGATATHTNPTKTGFSGVLLYDSVTTDIPDARWYDILDAVGGERVYDIKQASDVTINTDVNNTFSTPTALVLTTDYLLDLKMGRVFIKEGRIPSGEMSMECDLTADATAKDPDEVQALTQTNVVGALKFISKNPADGDKETEYQFHQVSMSAEGDFGLISDEFTTMQLTGVAEKNVTVDADSPTLTIRTHADA